MEAAAWVALDAGDITGGKAPEKLTRTERHVTPTRDTEVQQAGQKREHSVGANGGSRVHKVDNSQDGSLGDFCGKRGSRNQTGRQSLPRRGGE